MTLRLNVYGYSNYCIPGESYQNIRPNRPDCLSPDRMGEPGRTRVSICPVFSHCLVGISKFPKISGNWFVLSTDDSTACGLKN